MLNKIISLKNLIWFCAIGLAVFSGYYSVFGISKLFSGGSWSIIGMAAMLEFSKLVVITFLHDNFKTLKRIFKVYLLSSATVLMILTSVGVYGYLTNSYQETAKSIHEAQNKIALLERKKEIFLEQKNQIDTLVSQKTKRITSYDQLRLTQENSLNSQLNAKKGIRGLQKNIQSVDNSTKTLNTEISELNQKSIGLSDSISQLEQQKLVLENSTFTSEIGPLLYLSRLTGAPMDSIVNWFILVLVAVFDPLAVSLVIAANHLRHKDNEKKKLEELNNNKNKKETVENSIDKVDTKIFEEDEKTNTEYESEKPIAEIVDNKIEEIIDKPIDEKIKDIIEKLHSIENPIENELQSKPIDNSVVKKYIKKIKSQNSTKFLEKPKILQQRIDERKEQEMKQNIENLKIQENNTINDKKEKKSLEVIEENRILDEFKSTPQNEFYDEHYNPIGYRRGRNV